MFNNFEVFTYKILMTQALLKNIQQTLLHLFNISHNNYLPWEVRRNIILSDMGHTSFSDNMLIKNIQNYIYTWLKWSEWEIHFTTSRAVYDNLKNWLLFHCQINVHRISATKKDFWQWKSWYYNDFSLGENNEPILNSLCNNCQDFYCNLKVLSSSICHKHFSVDLLLKNLKIIQ